MENDLYQKELLRLYVRGRDDINIYQDRYTIPTFKKTRFNHECALTPQQLLTVVPFDMHTTCSWCNEQLSFNDQKKTISEVFHDEKKERDVITYLCKNNCFEEYLRHYDLEVCENCGLYVKNSLKFYNSFEDKVTCMGCSKLSLAFSKMRFKCRTCEVWVPFIENNEFGWHPEQQEDKQCKGCLSEKGVDLDA